MLLHPALRLAADALSDAIEWRSGVAGAVVLGPLADAPPDRLALTLLRVEPEPVTHASLPTRGDAGDLRASPPVGLAATCLLASTHADPGAALDALDLALAALHDVRIVEPPAGSGLKRMELEVDTPSAEGWGRMWRVLGVPLRPAVQVRLRLVGELAPAPDRPVSAAAR